MMSHSEPNLRIKKSLDRPTSFRSKAHCLKRDAGNYFVVLSCFFNNNNNPT